jgi:hypothetical protein
MNLLPKAARRSQILVFGLHQLRILFLFSTGEKEISLLQTVYNNPAFYPASYSMDARGKFSGGKTAGAWS